MQYMLLLRFLFILDLLVLLNFHVFFAPLMFLPFLMISLIPLFIQHNYILLILRSHYLTVPYHHSLISMLLSFLKLSHLVLKSLLLLRPFVPPNLFALNLNLFSDAQNLLQILPTSKIKLVPYLNSFHPLNAPTTNL
jgi:hypothetical protein